MDRGEEMQTLRKVGHERFGGPVTIGSSGTQGLAGWLLCLLRNWRGQREAQQKQLRLLETLPLGGKRQLMLVTCAGESFLVGGGLESVETIVRLKADGFAEVAGKSMEESCQ
jgi:flagellar biogenesis protein FliO